MKLPYVGVVKLPLMYKVVFLYQLQAYEVQKVVLALDLVIVLRIKCPYFAANILELNITSYHRTFYLYV